MIPHHRLTYRPEVDGLRAIAVLAVVLYHAGFGCAGGYVGVDVFFVISGFLITSLIWKDLESGRFSLVQFWERRARRIVPAASVVALVTLAIGWIALLPSDFADLGRASTWQAGFGANVHYFHTSGYFDGASDKKPLIHTWTLAVEEQFYLLIPALMFGLYRWPLFRRRRVMGGVFAALLVASGAWAYTQLSRDVMAAFYLLPGRAWELLLGSLIALAPTPAALRVGRAVREFLALAGLGLILRGVFVHTPFAGLGVVAPCYGAALLIWANGRAEGRAPTLAGALLSLRPVVFIGLISYSLYLWHWPLLAYGNYLALRTPSPAYRGALVALGCVLALLSWKYVETPFRNRQWGASRRSMFRFAGAGIAATFVAGLLCIQTRGFPSRLPEQAKRYAAAQKDIAAIHELAVEDIRTGELVPLGVDGAGARPAVLVWGDSHAMAALPAFDAFLKEAGLRGQAATHSSTAPLTGWAAVDRGLAFKAAEFNDAVVAHVARERIPNVVLTAYWVHYVRMTKGTTGSLEAALLTTIQRLKEAGAQPWVMLDVPYQSFDVPMALSRSIYPSAYVNWMRARPDRPDPLAEVEPDMITRLEAAGARILDPKPRFLDAAANRYRIEIDGTALYRDSNHLTVEGSRLILLPFLRDALDLGGTPSPRRNPETARRLPALATLPEPMPASVPH